MRVIWDAFNRDEWGRLVPGTNVRGVVYPAQVQIIQVAYTAEDKISYFYATEDGNSIYVPE